jgi:hypothetical protein
VNDGGTFIGRNQSKDEVDVSKISSNDHMPRNTPNSNRKKPFNDSNKTKPNDGDKVSFVG